LILLFTLKRLYGGANPPMAIIIWLLIITVLIILTYSLSSPAGFAMWFIVLLAVVLMKSGQIPTP
jgi:type IV secretory pathway TrbD component